MADKLLKALKEARDDRKHFIVCLEDIRTNHTEPSKETVRTFKAIRDEMKESHVFLKWGIALILALGGLSSVGNFVYEQYNFNIFKEQVFEQLGNHDDRITSIEKALSTLPIEF